MNRIITIKMNKQQDNVKKKKRKDIPGRCVEYTSELLFCRAQKGSHREPFFFL